MQKSEFDEILKNLRESGAELEEVEAKEAHKGTPTRLWESISALSNRSGGGTLLLGLSSDNYNAIGVWNPDQVQRDISAQCTLMVPPVRPSISAFSEGGKRVIVAVIPECDRVHKPCYYGPSGMSAGTFIRVGDGDRRMTDYEIQSLLAERGQPAEDRRPIEGMGIEALQRSKIEEFFATLRAKQPSYRHLEGAVEELMIRYGIARNLNGETIPTMCGLLMFGTYPQGPLPNLCITIVRYASPRASSAPGADDILENQKIEGTIPEMIEGAMAVLRRNMRKGTLKTGLLSEDVWEYPDTALREALVNAVVHRDYGPWAVGSQVQVKMFSDAIMIQNPGGLFGPVREDTLDEINVQAARNVHLMRLLESTGLVENRGSGIRTIIAQLSRAGLPPPMFKDGRTHFRAVFMNETLLDSATIEWLNRFANLAINERQRRALAYLKRVRSIRNKDYSRLNDCDSRQATGELSELRDMGIIRQIGTRGTTVYYLSEVHRSDYAALTGGMRPRHVHVLGYYKVHGDGPATVRQIARRLNMSPATVRLAVKELVLGGVLLPTEERSRSNKQAYRVRPRQ